MKNGRVLGLDPGLARRTIQHQHAERALRSHSSCFMSARARARPDAPRFPCALRRQCSTAYLRRLGRPDCGDRDRRQRA